MTQELKDSGERRTFPGGAQRDRGDLKPRPDLISPHANMREGMIFALGAQKYTVRNWEKGMPISECLASACRHIDQWKLGDTDEDHLAMARWNLGAIIHYEEEIKAGRMTAEFADMPHYVRQPKKLWTKPTKPQVVCCLCGRQIPDYECVNYTDGRTRPKCHRSGDGCPVPKPTFYLAGPMRGYDQYNFPAFDDARNHGIKLGFAIVSPADMDREEGFDGTKGDVWDDMNETLQGVIQRDIDAIMQLDSANGDGLAVLPGWEKSTGATAEVALARWLGLKIVSALDFMMEVTFG